ncbi:E3 ubiquitin-protein ligase RGLG2-like isoform X2 [Phoenix dactylifera]|uniref:E3 ubiquitin-protein ligase RGLG2-like isoform X2 n=1 Tax=Phoenix dactylifera TaxID=42345 RepID=A0A8B7CDP8_PHODC|nr:E3 ubiquitin-protein ligase RGLG2-like isoform X2 [Phoenix dactylifera]
MNIIRSAATPFLSVPKFGGVIFRLLEVMGGASSRVVNEWKHRSPSFHGRNCDSRMDVMHSRYSRIDDNYTSLNEVTDALQQAGLESSNLIVGIDFTKSNNWTGKYSYNGRCLHDTGATQNPYEQAISIIGQTLSPFDEDNLIPCFGFGDGPTSFAPIIEMAMNIVEQSGGQYHILLIIADGQVTGSENSESGRLSWQEQKTVEAIVKASGFPLSIILVGVGDGPWDMMKKYDDYIPERSFDNFQFVNFTEIMSKNVPQSIKESDFALAALMEIPSQYTATLNLGILGSRAIISPKRTPCLPPYGSYAAAFSVSDTFRSTSFPQSVLHMSGYNSIRASAPPAASPASCNKICSVCFMNPKDMAFDCGHQTCYGCGLNLQACPICYRNITKRIKLH